MSIRTISSSPWRRAAIALTATSAALAGVTAPAAAATAGDHKQRAFTLTVDGGDAFPESVAADSDHVYTGSIDDGTVYRGRLGAKTLEPFLPGGQDGRTQVTGIKTTGDRLLLA